MKRLIILGIAVFTLNMAVGQDHHVRGLFPTYNQNGKISEKLDYTIYSFLAIYPTNQTTAGTTYPAKSNAFYVELDAIYHLSKSWSLAGSYTYERVNPFRADFRNEHRAWLQLQHYARFDKLNLKNRIRYDFRFLRSYLQTDWAYRPRARYLLGIDFPLGEKSLYFAAYEELFFDTYPNRIASFSENWAFAGVGFNAGKNTKIEPGLLVISWIRSGQKDWLHQYFLQLTLIQQLNLKK